MFKNVSNVFCGGFFLFFKSSKFFWFAYSCFRRCFLSRLLPLLLYKWLDVQRTMSEGVQQYRGCSLQDVTHRKVRWGGVLNKCSAFSPSLAQLRSRAAAPLPPRRPPINVTCTTSQCMSLHSINILKLTTLGGLLRFKKLLPPSFFGWRTN